MTGRELRCLLLAILSMAGAMAIALFVSLPDGASGAPVEKILWSIRVPEALSALFAGGALGLSGLLFQTVLRNALADPYVLGVAGGSTLGAVLAMLAAGAGMGASGLPLQAVAAFAGGLLMLLLLLRLAGGSPETLLLAGVIGNTAAAAAARVITVWFSPEQVASVTAFLIGYVPTPPLWAPILLAVPALYALGRFSAGSRGLDVLLLSDDEAASLGVGVTGLRKEILILATLLASSSVALCGMLAFVGLLSPHAARLAGGHRHRILVPASFCLGAAFLLLAHGAGKLLAGRWFIPVGVYASLVGAPIFLWLLARRRSGVAT